MKYIVLLGGGGHARSCLDIIRDHGAFQPLGILEKEFIKRGKLDGVPIIGTDSDLPKYTAEGHCFIVAVGQIKDPDIRMRLFNRVCDLGGEMPVLISPKSHVSLCSRVGKGTIVMHFSFVGPGVSIGENCIVNTRALIEHDVTIGDHCHVSTGAIVNGRCRIGEGTFVGSGAVIKDGVQVGRRAVIGMGSVVRRDIQDGETVA